MATKNIHALEFNVHLLVLNFFLLLGMASVLRLIAPSILTFSKEIFISWSLPPLFRPEEEKHAIISSYIVSYTANGLSSGNVPLRPSNNSVNMTLPSLLPATEYNISVIVHYEEPAGLKGDLVYIVRKTKRAGEYKEWMNEGMSE